MRTLFAAGHIPAKTALPRVCFICREPYTARDRMLLAEGRPASHGLCSEECAARNLRIMEGVEPWFGGAA